MPDAIVTTTVIPSPPGIYGIIQSGSVSVPSAVGIVGLVGKASTGPLGAVSTIGSPAAVAALYGNASAIDRTDTTSQMANLAREAGNGGAITFRCVRPGAGGSAASLIIRDGSATQVGNLAHPYAGVFGNSLTVTIRQVAGDATHKELVVYNAQGVIIQNNRFASGSGDEAAGLAAATVGQPYAVFTKTATGTGVLAAITNVTMSTVTGVDPTVSNSDYTAAFALLSGVPWTCLVTDTESTSMQTAIQQYIDSEVLLGHLRMAAVGEATAVSETTRRADASALNSALVRYLGNGFVYPNGDGTSRNVEGFLAAAYDAGVQSTLGPGQSMTWRPVVGATALVGPVDQNSAIAAGMAYYQFSPSQGIRTGAGVDTLVNVALPPIWAQGLNTGWQHTEHVATAWGLLSAIDTAWQSAVGNPDVTQRPGNTPAGRATLVALANRVTKQYGDNGWIQPGAQCIVDPARPPTSNIAYFTLQNLIVALRAERLVISLPFGTP